MSTKTSSRQPVVPQHTYFRFHSLIICRVYKHSRTTVLVSTTEAEGGLSSRYRFFMFANYKFIRPGKPAGLMKS